MSKRNQPRVVGIGAANVDVHSQSRKSIVMRDSNPSYMATSVGGVTRNILENLARQGLPVALLSAVGDDLFGEKIIRDSSAAGIDMTHLWIKHGAVSSTYLAILDETGDMLLGMSDMRILEDLSPADLEEHRSLLRAAEAIVCDACLPVPLLESLVSSVAGKTPVLIDPVSTAYARQMEPIVGAFAAVKPNTMELSILSGLPTETEAQIEHACEALLRRGTKRIAVSRGDKGCYYADADGKSNLPRAPAGVEDGERDRRRGCVYGRTDPCTRGPDGGRRDAGLCAGIRHYRNSKYDDDQPVDERRACAGKHESISIVRAESPKGAN